jgi:exopolysaccharide biosynthesis polyprenyl glycosylphosphotransferase
VIFSRSETEDSSKVAALEPVEFRHTHLRLLDPDRERTVRPSIDIGQSWSRKFAATRAIDDDGAVEMLAAVRNSMRREQVYRRSLAWADGLSAVVIAVLTAAVWGASINLLFVLVPIVAVLVAKVEGLYDRDDMVIVKSTVAEWRTIFRAATLTTMGIYLIWWISTDPPEGRGIRMFAFILVGIFILQLPARALARRLSRALTTQERCLIVGAPDGCATLAAHLEAIPGIDLIGTVPDDDVDCSVAGVHELVEQLAAERIVVVPHHSWGEQGPLKLIQSCKWLGVRVSLMPTVMTVVGATAAIDALDSMVLLGVPRFGLSRSSRALKRAFDLAGATVALVLTAPLFAIVIAAIKLGSRGPALFRQERVGLQGRSFTIYKFRSMVDGAEAMQAELHHLNETAGLFKLADDPRITTVGRFLRRTYLDELPQLINVLRGDMSLVGPRPLVAHEDSLLKGYDRHRSKLIPGMTGPWQLRGPLDASLPELAKLDYMYASDWTIWADVDILLSTAVRVFRRGGR